MPLRALIHRRASVPEISGNSCGHWPAPRSFPLKDRISVPLRAMDNRTVITRFAPSPTGYVHVGNVRTAFFNLLLARQHGGRFILRSEDTDRERSREEYLEALCEDLGWLGLGWDEGPDRQGPGGPYRQSERTDIYKVYFDRLVEQGIAYPCYCSARELALSRKVQLASGKPPRYAGTCRQLDSVQRAARVAQGRSPTLRFRVDDGAAVEFQDLARGVQSFGREDIGDFVIRRADGSAAFFFSNAVDDSLMGVTHVLRGEDHVANTPRQILLLQALGLEAPHYGHLSLLVGDDGAPLSKRHGASSLRDLRQAGYLPAAILNHFLRLGHHGAPDGWLDPSEMPAAFSTGALGRAPARYDLEQLAHWQKEAVARASVEELACWLPERASSPVPPEAMATFVDTLRPNLMFPRDLQEWASILYGPQRIESGEQGDWVENAGAGFFQAALDAYRRHGDNWQAMMADIKGATGAKGKGLFMPLRLALTGRSSGPEFEPMLKLMPPELVADRLERLAAGR